MLVTTEAMIFVGLLSAYFFHAGHGAAAGPGDGIDAA